MQAAIRRPVARASLALAVLGSSLAFLVASSRNDRPAAPTGGATDARLAPLIARASDDDANEREAAAYALGSLVPLPEEAIAPLRRLRSDSEGTVQVAALEAIVRHVGERNDLWADVVAALADREIDRRKTAAKALEAAPREVLASRVAEMAAALSTPDRDVCESLVATLGSLGEEAAPVAPAIVRAERAWCGLIGTDVAVQKIGPAVVPPLLALFSERDPYRRGWGATLLERMPPESLWAHAAAVLVVCSARLDDPWDPKDEWHQRQSALVLLGRIAVADAPTGPAALDRWLAWLRGADDERATPFVVASLLGEAGSHPALTRRVLPALRAWTPPPTATGWRRKTGVSYLGWYAQRAPRDAPEVLALLQDSDAEIVAAVKDALAKVQEGKR